MPIHGTSQTPNIHSIFSRHQQDAHPPRWERRLLFRACSEYPAQSRPEGNPGLTEGRQGMPRNCILGNPTLEFKFPGSPSWDQA